MDLGCRHCQVRFAGWMLLSAVLGGAIATIAGRLSLAENQKPPDRLARLAMIDIAPAPDPPSLAPKSVAVQAAPAVEASKSDPSKSEASPPAPAPKLRPRGSRNHGARVISAETASPEAAPEAPPTPASTRIVPPEPPAAIAPLPPEGPNPEAELPMHLRHRAPEAQRRAMEESITEIKAQAHADPAWAKAKAEVEAELARFKQEDRRTD